eukprot:116798-Pleurochrysis_carterae.AAC.1
MFKNIKELYGRGRAVGGRSSGEVQEDGRGARRGLLQGAPEAGEHQGQDHDQPHEHASDQLPTAAAKASILSTPWPDRFKKVAQHEAVVSTIMQTRSTPPRHLKGAQGDPECCRRGAAWEVGGGSAAAACITDRRGAPAAA